MNGVVGFSAMAPVATTSSTSPLLCLGFCNSFAKLGKRHVNSQMKAIPIASSSSNNNISRNCRRRKRPFGLTSSNHHHYVDGVRQQSDCCPALRSSEYDDEESGFYDDLDQETEDDFLQRELERLESLEELLMDIEGEEYGEFLDMEEIDEEKQKNQDGTNDVEELFSFLQDEDENEVAVDDDDKDVDRLVTSALENALLQGVVPVSAGVGSECLPGDFGFDPLQLATKDYILKVQYSLLQSLPGSIKEPPPPPRPSALILRDYREAEIRHGRLAMLAAIFWPLQEMLDKLLLDEDKFGPLLFGPITLPYFPLLMTLIMMMLGYLDIYAKSIQDRDDIGDAFLPGDCFWDPLRILDGAPNSMKRNMQERELFNGRVAMLAVAAFIFEELTSHQPLIDIDGNELLFLPAYQIPYVQEWLDAQFSPTIYNSRQ